MKILKLTVFFVVSIFLAMSCSDDDNDERDLTLPSSIKTIEDIHSAFAYYAESLTETSDANISIEVEDAITKDGEVVIPANLTSKKAKAISINFKKGIESNKTITIKNGAGSHYSGTFNILCPTENIQGSLVLSLSEANSSLSGSFDQVTTNASAHTLTITEGSSINLLDIISGNINSFGILNNVTVNSDLPVTITIEKGGDFTGEYKDEGKKSTLIMGRVATEESSKWISQIVEYRPAPGQFINEYVYNASAKKRYDFGWGLETSGENIVGGKSTNTLSTGISLGAWGGYVLYTFDHSIINKEGYDFVIFQNSRNAEPGVVQVSFDRNGNGLPDDEWYEIYGSWHNDASTIKNYQISYKNPNNYTDAINIDYIGNNNAGVYYAAQGTMPLAPECGHSGHSHWPIWIKDATIEFTGTLIDWTFASQNLSGSFGYAKAGAGGTDFTSVIDEDTDTASSNKMNLDWAKKLDGSDVNLKRVDFVRIYTGIIDYSNPTTGEKSTEVLGSLSLTPAYTKSQK